MTLTLSNHTLDKLEQLFKTLGYKIRFEKGNFKTGACVLEHSKVIVINKFSDLEAKINALTALIQTIDINENQLDEKQLNFYHNLLQTRLQL